jgi:hypothetical protein
MKNLLLVAFMLVVFVHTPVKDGSDPMPICRNHPKACL